MRSLLPFSMGILCLLDPSSGQTCVYDLVLKETGIITSGETFQSPTKDNLSLSQLVDGNLVVMEDDRVLWESGVSETESDGKYFTRLQMVGNMLTYQGEPGNKGTYVWASGKASTDSSTYFLGLECDQSFVCIYKGTPDNPGDWLWKEPTILQLVNETSSESPTSLSTVEPEETTTEVTIDPIEEVASTSQAAGAVRWSPELGAPWKFEVPAVATAVPTTTIESTEPAGTSETAEAEPVTDDSLGTFPSLDATAFETTTTSTIEVGSESNHEPFSFYVMGDTPYNDNEKDILVTQLEEMNENLHPGSLFLVHVGDWQKTFRTNCAQTHFENMYNLFRDGSPLPTFVLAGDNDSIDCPDPSEAWERYIDTFVGLEEEWDDFTPRLSVNRWVDTHDVEGVGEAQRKEMFSFVEGNVLFLSMTLLNMNPKENEPPDDLFYERTAVSKAWVQHRLSEYKDSKIRGVVMFGHAMISNDLRPFFADDLRSIFFQEGFGDVPVLYICGDGHKYDVGRGLNGWQNFTRLMVDQGAFADPLILEVAPLVNGTTQKLEVDGSGKQTIVGNGLFRVDRQNGRYQTSRGRSTRLLRTP